MSVTAGARFARRSSGRTLEARAFPIEVVDIFRNMAAIPAIVDEAIATGARVVWMQQGLVAPAAARKARKAGLEVVMDRCMKIDHTQLSR